MSESKKVTKSSGNVYADLGFKNPEEMLAKADMAIQISLLIEKKHLTQKEAAQLFGVTQPRVSDLMRGKISGFSMDALFGFLKALDQDVQITIKPKPRNRSRAKVGVVAA